MAISFDEALNGLHGGQNVLIEDDATDVISLDEKRNFIIPQKYNTVLAYSGDVNTQIISFTLPNKFDNHQLGLCNHKKIKWKNLTSGFEGSSDLKIESYNPEEELFFAHWEVPTEALTHAGTLEISLSFYDIKDERLAYAWNTPTCKAFSVGEGFIDVAPTIDGLNLPAKNEILFVGMNKQILAPQGFNGTIAAYSDTGISKLYFQAKRNICGLDLLSEDCTAKVLVKYNGKTSTDIIPPQNIRESFIITNEFDLVTLIWELPGWLTNGQEEYHGPIVIGIVFEQNNKVWSTFPFSGLSIGDALVDSINEDLEERPDLIKTFEKIENWAGQGEGALKFGENSESIGKYSISEGFDTRANTDYSHAEGYRAPEDTTKSQAGMRGFSIINSEYSAINTLQLDSVEGIEAGYTFYYSALEQSGGLFKAWRPGAIPRIVLSVDSESNTITINEPLYFSKTKLPMGFVDGQVEHPEIGLLPGSPDPDRGGKFASEDGYVWYISSLACKLYFWDHPEIGTSSVTLGAHAEGRNNKSNGDSSHVEGRDNESIADYSHVEGRNNKVYVENGHAEGFVTLVAPTSDFQANGHAEGRGTTARGAAAHAEGYSEYYAIDKLGGYEGIRGATNDDVLNEWIEHQKYFLMANGTAAHAEGSHTLANEFAAHAEGNKTLANGTAAHSEGKLTEARGEASHAEGENTLADGRTAHAEGASTKANGDCCHAEGFQTEANVYYSHAEGCTTLANGAAAHAEGYFTKATADYSHAEGFYTIASGRFQHVQGHYNVEDPNETYAHIVGGGSSDTDRKNIYTLDWDGNAEFAGSVKATRFDGVAKEADIAKGLHADRLLIVDEGSRREANNFSLAVGYGVQTTRDKQLVVGEYNNPNQNEAYFVVGAGTKDEPRNAFYVKNDGAYSQGSKVRTTEDSYSKGDTKYYFVQKTELKSTTNDVSFGTATVANKTLKVVDTDQNLIFRTGRDASAGESYFEIGQEKVTETRLRNALAKIEQASGNNIYVFQTLYTNGNYFKVPDGAQTYAQISSISGYTKKCENLFKVLPSTSIGLIKGTEESDCVVSLDEESYLTLNTTNGFTGIDSIGKFDNSVLSGINTGDQITVTVEYVSGSCSNHPEETTNNVMLYFGGLTFYVTAEEGYKKTYTTTYDPNSNYDVYQYGVGFDGDCSTTMSFIGVADNLKIKVMVSIGSSEQPWEPYYEGLKSAKVKSIKSMGKNLLDVAAAANECFADNWDGTYTFTRTNNERFSKAVMCNIPMGSTISVSAKIVNSTPNADNLRIQFRNGNADVHTMRLKKDAVVTVTLLQDVTNIRFYVGEDFAVGDFVTISEPQIEYGQGKTEYKPYVGLLSSYAVPESLRTISGYCQGIKGVDSNVVDFVDKTFKKRVKEVVLNGDEPMSSWVFNDKKGVLFPSLLDSKCNRNNGICNEAETSISTTSSISENEIWIGLNNNIVYWCGILDTLSMNESEFRTYVRERYENGNPIRILYESELDEDLDVSELIPEPVYLTVEEGGHIEIETENGLEGNVGITYQVEV